MSQTLTVQCIQFFGSEVCLSVKQGKVDRNRKAVFLQAFPRLRHNSCHRPALSSVSPEQHYTGLLINQKKCSFIMCVSMLYFTGGTRKMRISCKSSVIQLKGETNILYRLITCRVRYFKPFICYNFMIMANNHQIQIGILWKGFHICKP